MGTIWLNDWQNFEAKDLAKVFALKSTELDGYDLLLASYKQGDESGYGFILFFDGQRYFEVNVSHDSECQLMGQWLPEETSIEALWFRLTRGNLGAAAAGENVFDSALKQLLTSLMQ